MKQEKGKAAFESVDEVLAEKIVKNSRDHGEKGSDARTEPSTALPEETAPCKTIGSSAAKWVIAIVLAAVVMAATCLFFGKCNKYWRR